MKETFSKKKISELGKIITGKTPETKVEKYYNKKTLPFITPTDYSNASRFIESTRFLSEDAKKDFASILIPKDSIMVTCIGSDMGKVAISARECITNQQINSIIPNQNIVDSDYLYYFFLRNTALLKRLGEGSGSTMPIINKTSFGNIEISLPPLSEQKRISSILSSFDNKIEQLKKENNILEDIAQSIFKEWFVKYNFPNKDGKPYKNNNGKMINSELGLIPEGWRVGKLADFGEIICGKTPSKKHNEYFNGKYPFIKIPDMTDIFIQETEDSLTEEGAQQLKGKLLPPNSICVSCIATIGKVGITTTDSFTNQQINSIIPKENALEYLYFTLKEMKAFLEQIGNRGSTTFNINTNMFSNLLIPCPPESIILNYHTNASPLFISIQKNMKKIETLLKEKNILLNHLIK